jgi:hypothetical protein
MQKCHLPPHGIPICQFLLSGRGGEATFVTRQRITLRSHEPQNAFISVRKNE